MTAAQTRNQPDAQKVFAAIAAIISSREGRQVQLVSVQRRETAAAQQKAG